MDLIVQCGHNTFSDNKQKAWPKAGFPNLAHKDHIAGRDEHSSFQPQAITHRSKINLPVTSWMSTAALKPLYYGDMIFCHIIHQLFTGLPETGSTHDLLKSHLGTTRQVTAWKAGEEGSLCNTHRRSGNLKNENWITGTASLFPFNTASSAGRLVTQAAPKSSCVISSYNLPTLRASPGACSSHKMSWQLFNLSLWHIMETQKPEVVPLNWAPSNFRLKLPEPPLSTHLPAVDL